MLAGGWGMNTTQLASHNPMQLAVDNITQPHTTETTMDTNMNDEKGYNAYADKA